MKPARRARARTTNAVRRSGRSSPAADSRSSRLAGLIRPLKFLLLDVDGVLTDGGIYYAEGAIEMKRFDIHDGMGIDLLQRSGLKAGILTGRISNLVERRARELGMKVIKQGFYDKSSGLDLILAEEGLKPEEIGYVGDDVQDLSVMRRVGFRAAPSSAVAEVRSEADYVCDLPGGHGAVREVIDLILRVRGLKAAALEEITTPGVRLPAGRPR